MGEAAFDRNFLLKRLVERGAAVNIQDHEGQTAVIYAADRGSHGCMEALKNAGADVNIHKDRGVTALMIFAYTTKPKCIDLLIKAEADVNIKNDSGFTAMMLCHDTECLSMLLRAGAQINIKHNRGSNMLTDELKTMQNKASDPMAKMLNDLFSEVCNVSKDQGKNLIQLLYAAGETIDETQVEVPDYLKPSESSLKHLCRETIRKHLLTISAISCWNQ